MAVGAPAHILLAQPAALGGRGRHGLHDVLAQRAGAGHQLIVQQALRGRGDAGRQHHVHHLHVGGEHRRLQALERHGLPRARGAAHGDQTGHAVAVLDGADGLQKRGLVAQAAMRKGQIDGSGHQVVRRDGEDHRVLVQHRVHDLLLVVLAVQRAADVLALRHGLGAGRAAGAVHQMKISQVDHRHLGAGLLAGRQRFLEQDLTVSVFSSGGNPHYFVRHCLFSFFLCRFNRCASGFGMLE